MTARTLTVSLGTRDSVPPRSVSRCLNHSDEGNQFDRRWWLLLELLEKGMSIDTKGSCPHPPAVGKIKHNSLLGEGLNTFNTLALSWLERKLHLYWNDTSKNYPQVLAKVCDVNQAGERPRLWFMTCWASCESEDFVLGLFLILKLKQSFQGELAYWDEVEIDLFYVSWSLVLKKAFFWLSICTTSVYP